MTESHKLSSVFTNSVPQYCLLFNFFSLSFQGRQTVTFLYVQSVMLLNVIYVGMCVLCNNSWKLLSEDTAQEIRIK